MENNKYLDLMAKYLSGNLAESEREALFSWVERDARNRSFFEEMIELWSVSNEYEAEPYDADTDAAWERFERRLDDGAHGSGTGPATNGETMLRTLPSSTKPPPSSRRLAWWRYAAAILLLIVAGLGWYADPLGWWTSAYATAAGETAQVQLPDGSAVTLNEETSLSYRPWWGRRRVHLEGEAFFEVDRQEGRPFEILSGAARTVVLGTAFNVRAYPEEARIEVTVEEGTVRVEERRAPRQAEPEAVVLEAGRSAVLDQGSRELVEKEEGISNATAWKTGQLAFDETPMNQVISVLERLYKVRIEVENEAILHCTLRHNAVREQPVDSLLEVIDVLFDEIEVRQQPDGSYLLSGLGCEE